MHCPNLRRRTPITGCQLRPHGALAYRHIQTLRHSSNVILANSVAVTGMEVLTWIRVAAQSHIVEHKRVEGKTAAKQLETAILNIVQSNTTILADLESFKYVYVGAWCHCQCQCVSHVTARAILDGHVTRLNARRSRHGMSQDAAGLTFDACLWDSTPRRARSRNPGRQEPNLASLAK